MELEAESQEATKSAALIAHSVQSKDKGKATWPSISAPKVNKGANQYKRGKRNAKKNISKVKFYNCNKLGYFHLWLHCAEKKYHFHSILVAFMYAIQVVFLYAHMY